MFFFIFFLFRSAREMMEGDRDWSYARGGKGHSRGRGYHHGRGRGQGHSHYRRPQQYDRGQRSDAVQAEVNALFEKSFTFTKSETDEAGDSEWPLSVVADNVSSSEPEASKNDDSQVSSSKVTKQY